MSVLVTGGSGFIGTHIIEELQGRGHTVKVFDRRVPKAKGVEWLDGDLRWGGDCDRAVRDTDAILHLAARISVDESLDYIWHYFNDNLMSTVNLFMAAAKHKVNHILFTSSCEVYGETPKSGATEEAPCNPTSPYAACFSDDTEILTIDGWKSYAELSPHSIVATMNLETKLMQFQQTSALHIFDYQGPMLRQTNRRLDMLVTPNHRVLHSSHWDLRNLKFLRADELFGKDNVAIPIAARWDGVGASTAQSIAIPKSVLARDSSSGQFQSLVIENEVSLDHWLEFFGWYLAEGSTNAKGKISQLCTCYRPKEAKMAFEGIGFRSSRTVDTPGTTHEHIRVSNPALWEFLSRYGKSREKYIPRDFLNLPLDKLGILFAKLYAGDGNARRRRYNTPSTYNTSSRRLADDVQEIALKLGFSANITKRLDRNGLRYHVNISPSRATQVNQEKNNSTWVQYKGKVWCVTVPNGNVLVRRNGFPFYSGNSKYAAERAALTFKRVHPELKLAVLRPFNTFGEWQKPYRAGAVIPTFILEALQGRNLRIHGDGEQTRDYVYVKDIARAHVDVLEKEREGVFNIATGRARSINSIAESIVKAVGKGKVEHVPDSRKGAQLLYSVGNAAKIAKETGWKPVNGFEPTLKKVIGWYETHDPLAPSN